jgi:hypothetical protein
MNWDTLDGRTSSTNRAFASDRTIKISASIATTFWTKRLNSGACRLDLSRQKTVIGSTTFALQTFGKGFNNAGEFADADHAAIRQM